jgi:uncharacterized membrane protein
MHATIVRGAYDLAVGIGLVCASANLVIALSADPRGRAWKLWFAPVGLMLAAAIAMLMGYGAAIGLVLVPSIIVNIILIFIFGHTLLPRREPLITRFRRFHIGHVTPAFASYTRILTVLWTALFSVMGVVSIVAALSGDIALWSWVSFIAWPLTSLVLFLGEHAYRAIRYGTEGRSSPLATIVIMLDPAAWRDLPRHRSAPARSKND